MLTDPACLKPAYWHGDSGMFCKEKDHDCCGKSRKAGCPVSTQSACGGLTLLG